MHQRRGPAIAETVAVDCRATDEPRSCLAPAIRPDHRVVVMDLSPYDLQVLDRYEEVESGVYRREPVQVVGIDKFQHTFIICEIIK